MFLNEAEPLDRALPKKFAAGTEDGRGGSQSAEFLVKVGRVHDRWLSLPK